MNKKDKLARKKHRKNQLRTKRLMKASLEKAKKKTTPEPAEVPVEKEKKPAAKKKTTKKTTAKKTTKKPAAKKKEESTDK